MSYQRKLERLDDLLVDLQKQSELIEKSSKKWILTLIFENINFVIIWMGILFMTWMYYRAPSEVWVQPELDAVTISKVSTLADSEEDFQKKLERQYWNIAEVRKNEEWNIVVDDGRKEVIFFWKQKDYEDSTDKIAFNDSNSNIWNSSNYNSINSNNNYNSSNNNTLNNSDNANIQPSPTPIKEPNPEPQPNQVIPQPTPTLNPQPTTQPQPQPTPWPQPTIQPTPTPTPSLQPTPQPISQPTLQPEPTPEPSKNLVVTTYSPQTFAVDSQNSIVLQGNNLDNVTIQTFGCKWNKSENKTNLVRVTISDCSVTSNWYIKVTNNYGTYKANINITLPSIDETALEQQAREYLLWLINSSRQSNWVPTISWNANLNYVAYLHSEEQLNQSKLYHTSSKDLTNRLYKYWVLWPADAVYVTENVGTASLNSQDWPTLKGRIDAIHAAMMNEIAPNDWHKRNILDKNVNKVGIFVSIGSNKIYITQNFSK